MGVRICIHVNVDGRVVWVYAYVFMSMLMGEWCGCMPYAFMSMSMGEWCGCVHMYSCQC